MAQRKRRVVSDEHKAAMAEGRTQSRVVSTYLEALETHKPKRGRKRTPESIDKRLDGIDRQLESGNQIKRLSLIQERIDLLHERDALEGGVDLSALEDGFAAVAQPYGARKGISYPAWRQLGVPAAVLKKAGIRRGGG